MMLSLSDEDRKSILDLARQGVREAVCYGQSLGNFPTQGIFAEHCGLFVTLHAGKKLRGCIGIIEARSSLGENLVRCAADAALHDPRFSRMRPEELGDLEIEVSLLSAIQAIRPEDVEIGKHGLLVQRGTRRGLLLPQVATEHHLGREQFLGETCVKAGLPREAWREPGTDVYAFECVIIAPEPLPQK
jgi:AmmeMemoRadiSam system protein A